MAASALVLTVALAIPAQMQAALLPISVLKTSFRGGTLSPARLPSKRRSPAAVRTALMIGTTDGTFPPSMTSLEEGFDRQLKLATDVPPCPNVAGRPPAALSTVCSRSLIGQGKINVLVARPESSPFNVESGLSIFEEGGSNGKANLWIVGRFPMPIPTRYLVLPMRIRRVDEPKYGSTVALTFPAFANGYGHVTRFDLSIHSGLFSSSCYQSLGFRARMHFSDGEFAQSSATQRCR